MSFDGLPPDPTSLMYAVISFTSVSFTTPSLFTSTVFVWFWRDEPVFAGLTHCVEVVGAALQAPSAQPYWHVTSLVCNFFAASQ